MSSDQRESGRRPRLVGPSSEAPARELVDAGFAWEIADAPLLHHGLNLADIGHVLDLRSRGLIPEPAAADLLRVLLDAYDTDPADFPYDAAPARCTTRGSGTSWSGSGTRPGGSMLAVPGGRRPGWR